VTRFGLQIPNVASFGDTGGDPFTYVADRAVAADRSGFSSLWVMDHLWQLPDLGGPPAPILEGYTLLGALAARTERVELGTLVTGVTYRNPALLARMVTTLDVISHGRAVLGIGAAWYEEEHRGLGFDFPAVSERFDRLDEAVQICRAMFTEHRPTFNGRYYRIEEAWNVPPPVRTGGPPILIGGSGERRTLRLVARYADRCNLFGGPDHIRHLLDVLGRHCESEGRDPATISTTRLGTLVPTATEDEADTVREFITAQASPDIAATAVIGTDEQILDQVGQLVDAGLDELIFNMVTAPPDEIERVGQLLSSKLG